MPTPLIEVAASIVCAPDGRVLMAERTPKQLSAGFWELPGGKIDPGESAQEAAVRELEEEIGIRALSLTPWVRYDHPFRMRRIRLHCFKVNQWAGTPHGREGQRLAWIDPGSPAVAPILPSVERVLNALGLPPLYAVCRSADHGGVSAIIDHIALGVRQGLRLLQLRAPDFSPDQRVALARRINAIVAPSGGRVLLVGSALEARRAGLSGVHTTGEQLRRLSSRPPVRLWLCSCRDEADLARAIQLGADAAVMSCVLNSKAHSDRVPLGWEGLKRLSTKAPLPLYAQGGIDASHLQAAQHAGAIGIATAHWDTTINAPVRNS
jgi:8-oxo-dGTP diphosphatase